jgi:hypothetical protein
MTMDKKKFNPAFDMPMTAEQALEVLERWGDGSVMTYSHTRAKRMAALLHFHFGLLTDDTSARRLKYEVRDFPSMEWREVSHDMFDELQTMAMHEDRRYRVTLVPLVDDCAMAVESVDKDKVIAEQAAKIEALERRIAEAEQHATVMDQIDKEQLYQIGRLEQTAEEAAQIVASYALRNSWQRFDPSTGSWITMDKPEYDDPMSMVRRRWITVVEEFNPAEKKRDHEIRDFVYALTDIATKYSQTQQLRERIAGVVLPMIKGKTAL